MINRMGMDTIELTMRVEDAFKVRFDDAELASIRTVGELYASLAAKLSAGRRGTCLSMRVFHELRSAMVALDYPRQAITPRAPLDRLIPRGTRRAAWAALGKSLPYELPALSLPTVLVCLMIASTLGGAISIVVGAAVSLSIGTLVFGLLHLYAKSWVMHWAASPMANRFGVGLATIGDLTKGLLSANFARVAAEVEEFHTHELWLALRSLVSQFFGVADGDVSPESRFVEDLGAS
jgi:acyl carrier protein